MRRASLLLATTAITACDNRQSTLHPAGADADAIHSLFLGMLAGAAVVWLATMAVGWYAWKARAPRNPRQLTTRLVIVAGLVVPACLLTVLLAYALPMVPRVVDGRALATAETQIAVTAEQWWWRVRYLGQPVESVELANEIWLPVNERTEIVLASNDVIHSFWVPALSGKMDMIPGRTTRISLEPTTVGRFRGVCAEYCGTSHAHMAFELVVVDRATFDEWRAGQQRDAISPPSPVLLRGRDRFLANGCGACHTVRGTAATGIVGPDLTHLGSRQYLAASTIVNSHAQLVRFIANPAGVKADAEMPSFGMLPREELDAIAEYLEALE